MTRMNAGVAAMVLGGLLAGGAWRAAAGENLCYNASLNSTNGALDGWGVDYDWTDHDKQVGNVKNVSALPEHAGRRQVIRIAVPLNFESKIETPLIPYEVGARYRCTFDILTEGTVSLRTLFLGYNLRPGIPPSEGVPRFQDMRRIYKGEASDVRAPSWKTMTVVFPHEEISELSYRHLKKVRYVTAFWFVPGATGYGGAFYLANVRVEKLPGKVKVSNTPKQTGAGTRK
jgi:hypothetical protein